MHRIHIFGASGTGTTTLARAIAQRVNGKHLDSDSYFWQKTDPPFTSKREPADRLVLIQGDVAGHENWVLSGSLCGWGDPLMESFTAAVFLELDPTIRLERLVLREKERYGARILPGGDMHQQHVEFLEWARSYDFAKSPTRSFDLHEQWMQKLKCPLIRLDSNAAIRDLCGDVFRKVPTLDDG